MIKAMTISKRRKYSFASLIRMLPVVIAALAIACSDNKTTNSLAHATDDELLYTNLVNSNNIEGLEIVTDDSTELDINYTPGQGDSVAFSLNSQGNYLTIPDSALGDSATLLMHIERLRFIRGNDSTITALVFNCFPEGQVFSESLLFDVYPGYFNNNPNSNAVKLYWYHEDAKKWYVEDTKHKNDPRLQFNIGHFSKYAISD